MSTDPMRPLCNDADVTEAVVRALHLSASLPQRAFLVSVENGHVTLTGEVLWEYQRLTAETVSRWINGVTGVTNLVEVRSRHTPRREPPTEDASQDWA